MTLIAVFANIRTSARQVIGNLPIFISGIGATLGMLMVIAAVMEAIVLMEHLMSGALPIVYVLRSGVFHAFYAFQIPLSMMVMPSNLYFSLGIFPLLAVIFGLALLLTSFGFLFIIVGAIYGMSKDIIDDGSTRVRRQFTWTKDRYRSFFATGVILAMIVILPIAIMTPLAFVGSSFHPSFVASLWLNFILNYTIPMLIPLLGAGDLILIVSHFTASTPSFLTMRFFPIFIIPMCPMFIIQFTWTYIAIGWTSMILPAVANRMGVIDATKQSVTLCRENFRRIFGLWTAFLLIMALMFAPTMLWLIIPILSNTFAYPYSLSLVDSLAMGWTVFASIFLILLIWPTMILAFTKLYNELTGKGVTNQEVPQISETTDNLPK